MHEKKAFSVVPKASPWRTNHVTTCLLRHSGESLQNGQFELRRRNWYFDRKTHKETAVSVWACQAGFWKGTGIPWGLQNRAHYTCSLHKWAWCGRSKKVRSFELYKFNPLSPHCGSIARGARAIVIPGAGLRIVTDRGNTVGRHS